MIHSEHKGQAWGLRHPAALAFICYVRIQPQYGQEMDGSNCNGTESRYFGKKQYNANLMELTALMIGQSPRFGWNSHE
jgi:hypothetical protein